MKTKRNKRLSRILLSLLCLIFPTIVHAEEPELKMPELFKVSELNNNLFRYIYENFSDGYRQVIDGLASLGDFFHIAEWIALSFSQPDTRAQIIEFSIEFVVSLAVAFALERVLTPFLLRNAKRFRQMDNWTHFWKDITFVAIGLIPIVVFGLGFYATFRLLEPVGAIYLQIASIFINGVSASWAFIRMSRMLLLPQHQKSHVPFSKEVLAFFHRSLKTLAIVILAGYFVEETGKLIGLPQTGHKLVFQITTFIILVMSLRLVWGLDGEYTKWLYGRRARKDLPRWERRFLAFMHFSPLIFVYFMVLGYMTWVLPFDEFLLVAWKVLITVMLIPLLFYGQYLIQRLQTHWVNKHLKMFAPDLGKRAEFYEGQIAFLMSSILTILFLLSVVWFWNGDPLFFFYTELGQLITEKVLSFIVILGISLFLLKAGRGLIGHYLDPKGVRGLTASDKARMKTMHGILSSVLQIFIWVPAGLLVLAELDVDILPATAIISVLGLGLSLGVRSIIQDFVTGIFMLLEDTFAVGDVIEVNGNIGTVESFTVRVMRMRSMDGTISSYPYGKIDKVANYSRQYSVAILKIAIERGEDAEKIMNLIQELDHKLRETNEDVMETVLEPAMVDGIIEVTDSAMTLRIRVKTKPKMHWAMSRLYQKEIMKIFDKRGIKPAYPVQRVLGEEAPKKKIVGKKAEHH